VKDDTERYAQERLEMNGRKKGSDPNDKKKGLIILFDILFVILFITIGLVFIPDYSIIFAYISIVPYLLLTGRKNMGKQFLLATLISLIWILISKEQYGYEDALLTIDSINLFPLFAWASGLFSSYVLYKHYEWIFVKKGLIFKLMMYLALYWPTLVILEWIAYHVIKIRNKATSEYAGLPLIDAIHAPHWMQISYFSMGPIMFLISYQLDRMEEMKKQ